MSYYKFWYKFSKKYGFRWVLSHFIRNLYFKYYRMRAWCAYKRYCYNRRIIRFLKL
jgi:hypothetical protein